jgi:hypothetical protein
MINEIRRASYECRSSLAYRGGRAPRAVAAVLVFLFSTGCSQNVGIPPAGQDKAPTITWNAFIIQQPSGYSGDVEPGKENVGTTTSVNVTEGARVQLSGSANNPGGVQSFHVTVKQSGETLADVTVAGAVGAGGQVPNLLSILGTNGAGGSGSQPIAVLLSKPVIVTAIATNFNAMSQTITVTYNPVPVNIVVGGGGPPPPPATAQLFISANHDLGPFQNTTAPPDFCKATITWSLTPGTLSGSAGTSTPYKNTVTANPPPSWIFDAPSGLYTARCPYGQMVAGLRPGTWSVAVNANGAGGSWQAQCQATLATGMNARTFRWGQSSCQ